MIAGQLRCYPRHLTLVQNYEVISNANFRPTSQPFPSLNQTRRHTQQTSGHFLSCRNQPHAQKRCAHVRVADRTGTRATRTADTPKSTTTKTPQKGRIFIHESKSHWPRSTHVSFMKKLTREVVFFVLFNGELCSKWVSGRDGNNNEGVFFGCGSFLKGVVRFCWCRCLIGNWVCAVPPCFFLRNVFIKSIRCIGVLWVGGLFLDLGLELPRDKVLLSGDYQKPSSLKSRAISGFDFVIWPWF